MAKLLLTSLILIIIPSTIVVNSKEILFLAVISSKSHKMTYFPLLESLASRGHQVTLLSSVKKEEKLVPNVTEIFTIDIEKAMEGINIFDMKEKNINLNPFLVLEEFDMLCRQVYKLPVVKGLLKRKRKFDLIILQALFNDCALGIVHRLAAPLILFNPTSAPGFMVSKIGGYFPPSYVPNSYLSFPDEMTFAQRFENFGLSLLQEAMLRFLFEPRMTALYREMLGDEGIPSVREILSNTSLILSNGHFSLDGPKPYLADVIDVGGIHCRPAKPLPKDLENFINKGGPHGFILFSVGSVIRGDQMSASKRRTFLKVFSQLKQQVLWKWESGRMVDDILPENVHLSTWFDQQDLLGDPRIKMFITHCGAGSVTEAIYHGVPLLGIPLNGDQPRNAEQAASRGFLVQRDWNILTEQSLLSGINEILNNSVYRENARKISAIFRDQPDEPLARAVYWTEYVMRHGGAPQLRSSARKLKVLQYHSIDVIGAYVAILVTLLIVLFLLVRWTIMLIKELLRRNQIHFIIKKKH